MEYFAIIQMNSTGKHEEYFLRLEAYFPKDLKNYWSILLERFKELSEHVSKNFKTEVYKDFNMVLFHEEELENFLHASVHFSKIRELSLVDSIVDKVLEISEFIEVYLSVKDNAVLKNTGENIYLNGINVRILRYGDKGFYTISYRLFKQNKGVRLIQRLFSKLSKRSMSEGFRCLFRLRKT